ncbi:C-3 sterol dehydrogenase [Pluteus cervinus]|uniref:C-3 sterol dehydrogenase n=1 Tax=Pluteus cervinus TaxID=181527 RepID=A0ACD3AWH9_9AGAR|nr:C-3 sterol dehydrogenase [Pluteus cervinus]
MSSTRDVYFVIGGSGFLGRHIVQQLLARGDIVSVFDIVQRYHDTPFYSGDMTDEDVVADALRKSGTTCIIHTASPPAGLPNPDIYYKVNVNGTKAVIAAAVATGVRKLVFTSSASVVFEGDDLADADERLPYAEKPLDAYNDSKAKAEAAVLKANDKNGLITVALRPAGIFGPGDRQVMTGLFDVYDKGQTHFQIGDNTNLFDYTYVGNVAKAHLLAADKLTTPPPAPPISQPPTSLSDIPPLTDAELNLVDSALPSINITTGKHRVPTCEARPLGPYVTPPPNAREIEAAFKNPNTIDSRPVLRTKFDALSEYGINHSKLENPSINPLQVAGQAFFITNGEPCYFWDFARSVWNELDKYFPDKRQPRSPFVFSRSVGLVLATCAEWFAWITGRETQFTRFKVTFTCTERWHNIERARRVLGYEPDVGLKEGIEKMVASWYEEYKAGNHQQKH